MGTLHRKFIVLNRQRVWLALESKRSDFQRYSADQARRQQTAGQWLDRFEKLNRDAILTRIDDAGDEWPGAIPTAEFDEATRLRMPFEQAWSNHQEARAWARSVLEGRTTVAVDGSQIAPDPTYSVPVGAIQVGWFINPHRADRAYVKDLEFEVLTPDDLAEEEGDEGGYAVQTVNQRRFTRECEKLARLMFAGEPGQETLHLFDGSFIISFAGKIQAGRADAYIQAIVRLLAASERRQAPLVGFVDTSNSHDMATLAGRLFPGEKADRLSDAAMLGPALPGWGDRTPFFVCARPDALSINGRAPFYKDVAFCYIRLNRNRPPARLEIPLWLLEAGLAEEAVNLVRAECVVGAGYPYAIETADALAVISHQDRRRFYALFQRFAKEEGLRFAEEEGSVFTESAKATSKAVRR
jgi:hypothetical protein